MILKTLAIPAILLFPANITTETITCELISPVNGSTVSGTIAVTALCSDNVVKVEFYKNGALWKTVYKNPPLTNAPKNFRFYRAEDFPAVRDQSTIALNQTANHERKEEDKGIRR